MLNQIFKRNFDTVNRNSDLEKSFDSINVENIQKKTKLWELEHNYHCSIIGTCLTLDEARKLLRSFRINVNGVSSYEIHTAIVTLISYNDSRTKKVQSYLHKKFKQSVQKAKKMNASGLVMEWKNALYKGDIIGTYWAVMLHPATSDAMRKDFYGDIHMQSHLSGADHRLDVKRLKQLNKEKKDYNNEIRKQQTKYQRLQSENTRLQSIKQQQVDKMAELVSENAHLTIENKQLKRTHCVEENRQLKLLSEKQKHKIDNQINELETSNKKNTSLNQIITDLNLKVDVRDKKIAVYKDEIKNLKKLVLQSQQERCHFKNQELCGKCVLYVGGKTNLVPYYRELVEGKSGIFLHHDGGQERNTQDLSQYLIRADYVIFPSNCISHEAYWKIIKYCKKQKKTYQYLKTSGLYSLSCALNKIVNE